MLKKLVLLMSAGWIAFSCQPPGATGPETYPHESRAVAAPFSWSSSGRLIDVKSDSTHQCASIKDPTVVNSGGRWHIYATVYNKSKSTYNMVYLSFTDWSSANSATQYYMDANSNLGGYKCAPHVFYSSNKGKWYLVYQTQDPAYSTASSIGGPSNWSAPTKFYSSKPSGAPSLWIDFFIISDSSNYYLFCSGDDGKLYRAQTSRSNFPNGFGSFTTVLSMAKNDLFEGACIYKINNQNKYLLLNEAIGANGRYYKAFTASSLTGSWSAIAGSESSPFAGRANVTGNFSNDVSHGELLRAGTDEYMTINDGTLQFLYQGSTGSNSSYDLIPWSLGLLTQKGGSGGSGGSGGTGGTGGSGGSGGSNSLVVRARGTAGNEQIRLTVGGTAIATWTLTTSMAEYSATTSRTGGTNIEFINDASGRDVQVDYLRVNGSTRQAESQTTNTGAWNSSSSSCGGVRSEWLHCNGYIGFGNTP